MATLTVPSRVGIGNLREAASQLIVSSEPACITLRDAISSDFKIVTVDKSADGLPSRRVRLVRGCLYDIQGAKVPLSLRAPNALTPTGNPPDDDILSEDTRARAVTHLEGRTLFLGTFMNHYGHFITESLSRYWGPESADHFDHLVSYTFVHNMGRPFVQRFHRYLTNLLGIPIKRVRFLSDPVRYDEIVVPEQLWIYDQHANKRLRTLYGRIIDRHAGPRSSGRVFLSRASYAGARLSNILAIEDVFASFGFKVLYPEELAIQRQLALYANCEVLASLSGSGMHNCLFARPRTLTIEVGDKRSPHEPQRIQQIANALAQVESHFVPIPPHGIDRADINLLTNTLRDILGERPRIGGQVALFLRRAALHVFSPKKAALRRERYPTKGRR